MKKLTFTALLLAAAFTANVLQAQLTITSFGGASAAGGATFDSGTGQFTGNPTNGDGLFESGLGALDITGATEATLFLTPTNVDPGTSFTIELYEGTFGSSVASFQFTSGELNSGTALASISFTGGDVTNVGSFALFSGGLPGETFDVNLSSLSVNVVPEPSAFALIAGCFGLAWVMVRRRA